MNVLLCILYIVKIALGINHELNFGNKVHFEITDALLPLTRQKQKRGDREPMQYSAA